MSGVVVTTSQPPFSSTTLCLSRLEVSCGVVAMVTSNPRGVAPLGGFGTNLQKYVNWDLFLNEAK